MTVIGITGGTGAGKTTALDVLREYGACVIDCDAVYHDLLRSCNDMLCEIGARFPGTVTDGVLDRKALGSIVFSSPEALSELNAITESYIVSAVGDIIEKEKAAGRKIAAIDAIALIESGLGGLCDFTVAVTAPAEMRIRRIMLREGISEEYAALRVSAQKQDSFFEENCTYLLYNTAETREEFEQECRAFFAEKIRSVEK